MVKSNKIKLISILGILLIFIIGGVVFAVDKVKKTPKEIKEIKEINKQLQKEKYDLDITTFEEIINTYTINSLSDWICTLDNPMCYVNVSITINDDTLYFLYEQKERNIHIYNKNMIETEILEMFNSIDANNNRIEKDKLKKDYKYEVPLE